MVVVASPTTPPIAEEQNTDRSQRILAAQAVLYGDVKQARNIRVLLVVLAALALAAFTIWVNPGAAWVGGVGGLVVLLGSVVAARRERRLVNLAVSVQEEFDTTLFQLPWNPMCVPHRPTGQEVNEAAARYAEGRTRDWYPDTGTVHRPLDVLICQQSNLGWGAAMHRKWFGAVTGAGLVLVAALAAVWAGLGLDAATGLNALIIPFTPVAWEAMQEAMRHYDAAQDKGAAQQLLLGLWRTSLTTDIHESQVRETQNAIAQMRRENAQVPDWFDTRFRDASERTMRATADDLAEVAARHGKA